MVPSQLTAVTADTSFHSDGVGFASVMAEKSVAHAVVRIRNEVRCEIVIRPGFIKEIIFNDAITIARTTCVEGHLKVLIVDLNVMVGELTVGKDAQLPGSTAEIPELDVPQLD